MNIGDMATKRLKVALATASPIKPKKFQNIVDVQKRMSRVLELAASSGLSNVIEQPTTIFTNRKIWTIRTQSSFDKNRWSDNFYLNKESAYQAYKELKKVFTVSRVTRPKLVTIKDIKFPKS